MTQNQIAYHTMIESGRHNRSTEQETNRHNVVTEGETNRHNVVTEGETSRHNLATEGETARHNRVTEQVDIGKLAENVRSNRTNEALNLAKYQADTWFRTGDLANKGATLLETQRHNQAGEAETQRHNYQTESVDVGRLNELNRSNLASEKLGYANVAQRDRELKEQIRHNLESESNASRLAGAQEALSYSQARLNTLNGDWVNINNQLGTELSYAKREQIRSQIDEARATVKDLENQITNRNINTAVNVAGESLELLEKLFSAFQGLERSIHE